MEELLFYFIVLYNIKPEIQFKMQKGTIIGLLTDNFSIKLIESLRPLGSRKLEDGLCVFNI